MSEGPPSEANGAREVTLPIEDRLDLHAFRPADIPSVVEAYLDAAREKGLREVRLIHGRGIGFQRERVRQVLRRRTDVEAFTEAPPERGGWGATLVWLKPPPQTRSVDGEPTGGPQSST
jgi:DNA-nicking Smr family endonuclease